MPRLDVPIVVVDDARFSNTMIGKAIRSGGYSNIRHATSASEALKLIEESPADILIADWLMPEMDGLQLAQRVRQIDETGNHYTYVILLTAKEGGDSLSKAFEEGVDDFVNKSDMNHELLPRISAAQRSVDIVNRLLRENQSLLDANQKLRNLSTIDPLTGLGNLRHAIRMLRDTLKHTENREGATCYLLLSLTNFAELEKRFSREITDQMAIGIGRRLRQLVRPLDVVCRLGSSEFAIIMHVPDTSHCTPASFRRLFDSLNNKEFKTVAGFLPAQTTLTVVYADKRTGVPDTEVMMAQTKKLTERAASSGKILVEPFTPPR